MANIFDLYRNLFGGNEPQQGPQQSYNVGADTIPLSLDRTPVNDPYTGTALHSLMTKLGDIGTAIPGLVERAQLGGMNALGMRQGDGDIYRSKIPVAPGIEALGDAANFATGGLQSSLFPAAGAYREAARYGAREAPRMTGDLLADTEGALRLSPKAPSAARSDLPAPNIGMGTDAPLFDYSRLTERPNVPQHLIEREPLPAKGIPEWLSSQVNDPAMREQYKQVLQLGRGAAGDTAALGWWNTFPLRERTIGLLGETAGDERWRSGMNMWSATSPRSPFPNNIRQASYFENMLAEGRPLPELIKKYQEKNPNAFNLVPVESAPPGYANFPQHIVNIQNLLQPDRLTLGNEYPLSNPKPATMAQNLVGNWMQPTMDVRDLKAMGLKYKSGKAMDAPDPTSAYGYIENQFHRPLAEELKLDPAQMQSATWLGVPEYFKGFDRSGLTPALGTLEESARRTAKALGLTPEQVIDRGWIGREFKLLSGAGLGVGLGAGLLGGAEDDDQRPIQ